MSILVFMASGFAIFFLTFLQVIFAISQVSSTVMGSSCIAIMHQCCLRAPVVIISVPAICQPPNPKLLSATRFGYAPNRPHFLQILLVRFSNPYLWRPSTVR